MESWRRVALVVIVFVMVLHVPRVMLAESARPISRTIEQGPVDDGWKSDAETTRTTAAAAGGFGGGASPVWDAETEAESPPAQRQRDRSLGGMSKRLVPTGPNPLHN